MTLEINRRAFLQALIAAGASYALPAKATEAQVDKIWAEALAEPWFFEVGEHGRLVDPSVKEPQLWKDIFDSISTDGFTTPGDVIFEVKGNESLMSYLNDELVKEIESLEEDLEEQLDAEPPKPKKEINTLSRKIDALKDFRDELENPWEEWVELEGKKGVGKFKELIDDWLEQPIDWMQSDFFPLTIGSQGAAFGFFEDQPRELLKAIGVKVIEGQLPGSTYYAAELRVSIPEANQAAEALGLPFRFRSETA